MGLVLTNLASDAFDLNNGSKSCATDSLIQN